MNEFAYTSTGRRRTQAVLGSRQLTKGHYATPKQKSPRPPRGLRPLARGQSQALALVGFVV